MNAQRHFPSEQKGKEFLGQPIDNIQVFNSFCFPIHFQTLLPVSYFQPHRLFCSGRVQYLTNRKQEVESENELEL